MTTSPSLLTTKLRAPDVCIPRRAHRAARKHSHRYPASFPTRAFQGHWTPVGISPSGSRCRLAHHTHELLGTMCARAPHPALLPELSRCRRGWDQGTPARAHETRRARGGLRLGAEGTGTPHSRQRRRQPRSEHLRHFPGHRGNALGVRQKGGIGVKDSVYNAVSQQRAIKQGVRTHTSVVIWGHSAEGRCSHSEKSPRRWASRGGSCLQTPGGAGHSLRDAAPPPKGTDSECYGRTLCPLQKLNKMC